MEMCPVVQCLILTKAACDVTHDKLRMPYGANSFSMYDQRKEAAWY
jgi:hypothetical protein